MYIDLTSFRTVRIETREFLRRVLPTGGGELTVQMVLHNTETFPVADIVRCYFTEEQVFNYNNSVNLMLECQSLKKRDTWLKYQDSIDLPLLVDPYLRSEWNEYMDKINDIDYFTNLYKLIIFINIAGIKNESIS